MTQTLIDKLEAAKLTSSPGKTYWDSAINEAIAIVREHEAAPLTDAERADAVEVMAVGAMNARRPNWVTLEEAKAIIGWEYMMADARGALAALLEKFEIRRRG